MNKLLKSGIKTLLERVKGNPATLKDFRRVKSVFLYAKFGGSMITKAVYIDGKFVGRVTYTKKNFRAESRFLPNIGAIAVCRGKYFAVSTGMQIVLDSDLLLESYRTTHKGW